MRSLRKTWLFRMLPIGLRRYVVQRRFRIDPELGRGLVVKRAETREELAGAFRLLHDSYVKAGFSSPHSSGLRLLPHHFLPSTIVLVVKQEERVLATVTLTRDCQLGLPMDKVWDLAKLRRNGARVAEITCLAVDFTCRRTANILFLLLKYIFEYGRNYLGADFFGIVIHPKDIPFYETLLPFQRLDKRTIPDYLGAPAVAMFLNLRTAKAAGDVGDFFLRRKMEGFQWPSRKWPFLIDTPATLVEHLRYFASAVPEALLGLDEKQKKLLLYPFPNKRGTTRIQVELTAELSGAGMDQRIVTVKNLSQRGIRLAEDLADVPFGTTVDLRLTVPGVNDSLLLNGKLTWRSPRNGAGILVHAGTEWVEFIRLLERELPSEEEMKGIFDGPSRAA